MHLTKYNPTFLLGGNGNSLEKHISMTKLPPRIDGDFFPRLNLFYTSHLTTFPIYLAEPEKSPFAIRPSSIS
jgi:hypothetical protein